MKSAIGSVNLNTITSANLRGPIEAIAFWSAIALPFLHVPLLFYGLETTGQVITFLGLLTMNVVAFIVGHSYNSE